MAEAYSENKYDDEIVVRDERQELGTELPSNVLHLTLVKQVHVHGSVTNEFVKTKLENCDGALVQNIDESMRHRQNTSSKEKIERLAGDYIDEIHKVLIGMDTIEVEMVGLKKCKKVRLPGIVATCKETILVKAKMDEKYHPGSNAFTQHEWEGEEVCYGDMSENYKGFVLVGPGGCGKSTTLKQFAKDVAMCRIKKCERIKLVLFIQLKYMDDIEGNLNDILLIAVGYGRLSDDQSNILIEWIRRNASQVMIALDGYDQLCKSIESDDKVPIGCHNTARKNQWLYGLLDGSILPGALVVLSSREYALQRLPFPCIPDRVLKVVGLKKANIDQLIIELSNEEVLQRIMKSDPMVFILCSSPLFLIYVVWANNVMKEKPPETKSGILMSVIINFLSSREHIRGTTIQNLLKLSKLAFYGTRRGKVVFNSNEIQQHGISLDDLKDMVVGFPRGPKRIGNKHQIMEGEFLRYFIHQSVQELLTALNILLFPAEEFDEFLKKMEYLPNMEEVQQMVFGLLFRSENIEMLGQLAKKIEGQIERDKSSQTSSTMGKRSSVFSKHDTEGSVRERKGRSAKEDAPFKRFLSLFRIRNSANEITAGSTETGSDSYDHDHEKEDFSSLLPLSRHRNAASNQLLGRLKNGKVRRLQTLRLLYEMGDTSFIQAHVKKIILNLEDISDAFRLGKLLQKLKYLSQLNLWMISDDMLRVIVESCEEKIPKIGAFIVHKSSNFMKNNFFKLANASKSLVFFSSSFTKEELKDFYKGINKSKKFVRILLFATEVNSEHVEALMRVMSCVTGDLILDDQTHFKCVKYIGNDVREKVLSEYQDSRLKFISENRHLLEEIAKIYMGDWSGE